MITKYFSQISNNSQNFISLSFVILITSLIFSNHIYAKGAYNSSNSISTIILDAGHGGKDPGAVVGRAREKEIVLDIALRLGRIIKQELPDVKVIYTRKGDYFVPLFERSVIANKSNANLFISIHANYCRAPSVKGTETYILGLHRTQDNLDVAKKENSVILLEEDYKTRYEGFDPNSPESYIMFELIQDNYIEQSLMFAGMVQDIFRQHALRNDRDVRQAGFLVLRETAMPSVLIETGYLSNRSEAAYLMTQNGRETIAASIFRSIKNYKSRIESRINVSPEKKDEITQKITKNDPEIKVPIDIVPGKIEKKDPKSEIRENRSQNITDLDKALTKNTNDKTQAGSLTFAIQIAASKVKLPLTYKIFKGIENIRELKIGDYFKYYCMECDSPDQIKQNLRLIQKKIPDAFIVGLKNGQVIPYKEAINLK